MAANHVPPAASKSRTVRELRETKGRSFAISWLCFISLSGQQVVGHIPVYGYYGTAPRGGCTRYSLEAGGVYLEITP